MVVALHKAGSSSYPVVYIPQEPVLIWRHEFQHSDYVHTALQFRKLPSLWEKHTENK